MLVYTFLFLLQLFSHSSLALQCALQRALFCLPISLVVRQREISNTETSKIRYTFAHIWKLTMATFGIVLHSAIVILNCNFETHNTRMFIYVDVHTCVHIGKKAKKNVRLVLWYWRRKDATIERHDAITSQPNGSYNHMHYIMFSRAHTQIIRHTHMKNVGVFAYQKSKFERTKMLRRPNEMRATKKEENSYTKRMMCSRHHDSEQTIQNQV